MTFCSASLSSFSTDQLGTSGDVAVSARSKTKTNKHRCGKFASPSDEEAVDVEAVNEVASGEEGQSVADDESVDYLQPATKRSLQEDAYSLYTC